MPFQRPTLQDISQRVQADFAVHYNDGKPLRSRTLPSVLAHTIAGVSHMLHGHLDFLSQQIFPDTCTMENLEKMAHLRGLARTLATFARGKVTFTGTPGALIDPGTEGILLSRPADLVSFEVTEGGRLDDQGVLTVPCKCEISGAVGNTPKDTVLTLTHGIAGVTTVSISERVYGGFDLETHDDLLRRYVTQLKYPTRGGTLRDYENIALELPGVKKVWVYENIPHVGEVGITFIMNDLFAPIPTLEQIDRVKAHLEARKPMLARLNVYALTASPIQFRIKLRPQTPALKAALEDSLRKLIFEGHRPEGKILRAHLLATISKHMTTADYNFELVEPAADVTDAAGELSTFGGITWEDFN